MSHQEIEPTGETVPEITFSPEATAVLSGIAVSMNTLQGQLEGIHQLDESQLAEVYAGLRVLRARWAMPPHTQAHDVETVPGIVKSLEITVATRHTRQHLGTNGKLGIIGVEVEGQDEFVRQAEEIRDVLGHEYARQELSPQEIASADRYNQRLIQTILGQ